MTYGKLEEKMGHPALVNDDERINCLHERFLNDEGETKMSHTKYK